MGKTVRYTTMDKCRQASYLRRNFRGVDKEVLAEELRDLHSRCPGTITIQSQSITAHCTCDCHRERPDAS